MIDDEINRKISVGLDFFDLKKAYSNFGHLDRIGVSIDLHSDLDYLTPKPDDELGDFLDMIENYDPDDFWEYFSLISKSNNYLTELRNLNNIHFEKHTALLSKKIIRADEDIEVPGCVRSSFKGVDYLCDREFLEDYTGLHLGEVEDYESKEEFENVREEFYEECDRIETAWVENLFLVEPTNLAIAIVLFSEKVLLEYCNECHKLNFSEHKFVKKGSNVSLLESQIKYLKEDAGLEIQLSPSEAEFLFSLRTNRNAFVQSNWEGISFGETKASDMIKFARDLVVDMNSAMSQKWFQIYHSKENQS